MEVQFSNNEGHVIITLCGRLDTSCSMQTKTDIEQYLASHAPPPGYYQTQTPRSHQAPLSAPASLFSVSYTCI